MYPVLGEKMSRKFKYAIVSIIYALPFFVLNEMCLKRKVIIVTNYMKLMEK